MLPQTLIALTLLISLPSGVWARRGGGDSDSDDSSSSGDSTSDGDSSSSSDDCDPFSGKLYTSDLLPRMLKNWTSSDSGRSPRSSTEYDGSFFLGEAFLNYKTSPTDISGQIRLLAYAWIGPRPPYPVGPSNPYIIGFKAWKSAKPLDEIASSYEGNRRYGTTCEITPDLMRFASVQFVFDSSRIGYEDIVDLDFAPDPADGAAVRFNGTNAPRRNPVSFLNSGISLPAALLDDHPGILILAGLPGLNVTGSVTNTSMEIRLEGEGKGIWSGADGFWPLGDRDVSYSVSFKGTFDGDNSTAALDISQGNQTLSWVPNEGVRAVPGVFQLVCWWWFVYILVL
ncbi:hypothetical protein FE257_010729 [Aspergillus nanangensis]|uniref:Uncharacterized protein n=1 Tax=Aspergillus nanangensis TaxID=2582783 RepID=A0AAD4CXA4_ASPNN|nr:hypothetical protein FE257_010729 [Aspergillus nanangensis]